MEYWYDIYGLSENRNVATIEAFLRHFTTRNEVEARKNEVITLIPDIPLSDRDKLFKPLYAYANGSPLRSSSNTTNGPSSQTELETVVVDTLSQAIELGVSRKKQAFSLYIPSYTRAHINFLIIHFTLDNQLVLGLSVSSKGDDYWYDSLGDTFLANEAQDQDNMVLAKEIRDEMAGIISLKATAITTGRAAPDTEQEFMALKNFYEIMDGLTEIMFNRISEHTTGYLDGYYYAQYRNLLHRQRGLLKPEDRPIINLFDNFSVGNNQGQVYSVIKSQHGFLGLVPVHNPEWKDVVKLPYLGYLLSEAVSCANDKFRVSAIHRVSILPKTEVEYLRESSKNGDTTFEGVKAAKVVIEETYCLNKIEDLKRLAEEGFFKFGTDASQGSTTKAFEEWLIKYGQTELYLTLLLDPDFPLELHVNTLLSLVGKLDWQLFLSLLHQNRVGNRKLIHVLTQMLGTKQWQHWQIKDILQMASFTPSELQELLDTFASYKRFELFELVSPQLQVASFPPPELQKLLDTLAKYDQYELIQLVYAQTQVPSSLPDLVNQIKAAFSNRVSQVGAAKIINFYLQEIGKVSVTFCDYSIIHTLAATEAYEEPLEAALRLLPEKQRHSKELLNIALTTNNQFMLQELAFSPNEMENIRRKEEAQVQESSGDLVTLIKKATEAGNYFQVSYLAPQVSPAKLLTPMLHASKMGMLGIVKILVEQGKVAPDCWGNYPVKTANKGGLQKLKQYLLSKGAKDEEFT